MPTSYPGLCRDGALKRDHCMGWIDFVLYPTLVECPWAGHPASLGLSCLVYKMGLSTLFPPEGTGMSYNLFMALSAQGVDAATAPCRWARGREDGDSCPSLTLNAQALDFGFGKWCPLILVCFASAPHLSVLCGFAFSGLGLVMFS